MAKILTPIQFAECPRGTIFAFGEAYVFGPLLVLDEFIGPLEGGAFGFYAIDPAGVESDDCESMIDRIDAMRLDGASYPASDSSSKYMSYDGDPMDFFLVYEREDWDRLAVLALSAFKERDK